MPQSIAFNYASTNTYFAGRMVQQSGVTFIEDRLGSNGKYFPYGEERNYPALPNDQVKFATYTRDSATGLDYADQRYYSAIRSGCTCPEYLAEGLGERLEVMTGATSTSANLCLN